MTDTTPAAPARRIPRRYKLATVLLLLVAWSLLAGQWQERGCDAIPQSYVLVLTHGTPDHWQGCESEPAGPAYTDRYGG